MMSISSQSSQILVVDANVAVWAVVPVIAQVPTLDRLETWHAQHYQILSPDLWLPEAISVTRFLVYKKILSQMEGDRAIEDLFDLEIQTIPVTRPLCHAALSWAAKLQQARAYDSLYLALAEQKKYLALDSR